MNHFNHIFKIDGRTIGDESGVYIIADAGLAHFGDLQKAMDLVDLAIAAGVDAFKTQAFQTSELVSKRDQCWFSRLKGKEINFEFVARMKERCDSKGITFLCTPHDFSVLRWLKELNVQAIKIGSGERSNLPFIRQIAKIGKPVILSTGMYEERHITETLKVFADERLRDLALLHCVTCYPTPVDQVNLKSLNRMRELFVGPVGYSDHTHGHHVALAAVALNASIIEKHITLDFDIPDAQDWKVSAGPKDFPDFVRKIRDVEKALGRHEKRIQSCEHNSLNWATKSLVARTFLSAGTKLLSHHLATKRPGDGLSPDMVDKLLGKTLVREIEEDFPVTIEDVCD